jgi:simple sugar transport system permease protein
MKPTVRSGARRLPLGYRVLANQEILLVGLILLLLAAIIIAVPGFFHVETLFNVLRGSMVSILFALGVLLVLISGGIDVSFLAIGIFSAYLTVQLIPDDGPLWATTLPFGLAAAIGLVLGLVNAAVVLGAKVSTLIATLATGAAYTGIMFAFIGGRVIPTLPEPLRELGQLNLLTAPGAARGTTRLNILILLVAVICVLIWAFLTFTIAGRSVYSVGGDPLAAERAAISVPRTRTMVFAISGALYGVAGMTHVTLSGRADPTTFSGAELDILAAVVLGGALITGGKGTVRGTVLGVLLIALISTSLVPLGVPSIWQQATVGVLLIIGVTLQTVTALRKPDRSILAAPAAREKEVSLA